jgi:hypothetical protein
VLNEIVMNDEMLQFTIQSIGIITLHLPFSEEF